MVEASFEAEAKRENLAEVFGRKRKQIAENGGISSVIFKNIPG
jgi:hypothetical protein